MYNSPRSRMLNLTNIIADWFVLNIKVESSLEMSVKSRSFAVYLLLNLRKKNVNAPSIFERIYFVGEACIAYASLIVISMTCLC